jgi:signal transduction histidine kinase/ActR/RegA family two-component response regulator
MPDRFFPSLARQHAFAVASGAIVVLAVAWGLWQEEHRVRALLPHGYCFTWIPGLLWLHVVSDFLIGVAYVSIPLTLLAFVRRRADLPFNWMFVLFALFIMGCGATHWISIWTVWNPDYWLSGSVKGVTAGASLLTAGALVQLMPRALALPTVSALREAKEALEREVEARKAIEEELRAERAALAVRVDERTADLHRAMAHAETARHQAEAANQMKDQFLAKVSHELRTPLQSMTSWLEVLNRGAGDARLAGVAIERLNHNFRAQARLIDDLLDIASILSGKMSLQMTSFDPADKIREAVGMVAPLARSREVQVQLALPADLPPLVADATRFEQVVWNLVGNAVHASDNGGRVQVCATVEDAVLRIDVQDFGVGIERADLQLIFEPFRQGARARRRQGGLGLGLAITRSIVEQFGGRIEVHSEGPGRGAVFTVRLPLQSEPLEPGSERPAQALGEAERAAIAPLRVLLVEDEADIGAPLRLALAERVAHVALATSYDEAVAAMARERFDVLLSDINLRAERNGHDVARHWRASRADAGPAVALSAYGGAEDHAASAAAGFTLHLVKPLDGDAIAAALARLVRRAAGPAGR